MSRNRDRPCEPLRAFRASALAPTNAMEEQIMQSSAVIAQIYECYQLLESYRSILNRYRQDPPVELFDMHHGAEIADSILGLVRDAHRKGVVDREALRATMQLANAWLAFDDELDEVLALIDLPSNPRWFE